MRNVIIVVLAVSLFSPSMSYAGQGAPPVPDVALQKMGKVEMAVGVFLAGMGGLAIATSGPTDYYGHHSNTYAGAAIIGGGVLMWSGHRHLQQAKRPSIQFGVSVGAARSGVVVRRTW